MQPGLRCSLSHRLPRCWLAVMQTSWLARCWLAFMQTSWLASCWLAVMQTSWLARCWLAALLCLQATLAADISLDTICGNKLVSHTRFSSV